MRAFLFLTISLFSFSCLADCQCQFEIENQRPQEFSVANPAQCFQKILSYAKDIYHSQRLCNDDSSSENIQFSWECGEQRELAPGNLKCAFLAEDLTTDALNSLVSIGKKNVSRGEPEIFKLNARKIEVTFSSEDELKNALVTFVPGAVFDRPINEWQFTINLPNDNKGLGLFDILFDNYGNDQGNTHGLFLSVSKGVDEEYHLTFEYQTNLYTQKTGNLTFNSDGTSNQDQLFLEDNLAELILDNRDSNKSMYFVVGIGWHKINEEDLGPLLLSSAKQQKKWHEDLGRKNAPVYNYIGGHGVREGLRTRAGMGRDDVWMQAKKFRLSSNIEAGVAISAADDQASHVYSSASVNFDYQKDADSYAFRIGINTNAEQYHHSGPTQLKSRLTFEFGKNSYSCGTSLVKSWNEEGPTYLKYDLDRDLLTDIYCRKKF